MKVSTIAATFGLGATLLAAGVPSVQPARAEAPFARVQAPGYFRFMLGDFEITALNDGAGILPMDTLLHGAGPGEVQAAYDKNFLPTHVFTSRNQYLINTGKQLILVDTGDGDNFDRPEGRLRESLAAAGYTPDQVDIVVFTHLHGDHIGGLWADDKPVFHGAVIRLEKRELDYWMNATNQASAPEAAKGGFDAVQANLGPYVMAGQVKTFDGATEIAPGVRSVPAYGHTPGHSFYLIESRGQKLMLWGDVVHSAPVQFPDPKVTIGFDSDEPTARVVRAKAFADAAKGGYWVAGDHLPFPGVGHLRAEGDHYAFVPVNWKLNP